MPTMARAEPRQKLEPKTQTGSPTEVAEPNHLSHHSCLLGFALSGSYNCSQRWELNPGTLMWDKGILTGDLTDKQNSYSELNFEDDILLGQEKRSTIVYIYIYIRTHIYIHTYLYTWTHTCRVSLDKSAIKIKE